MPCEEQMGHLLADLLPHASARGFIDPKRYVWKVGCYIPKRKTWFWPESDDSSKSKCGCFLADETLRAASSVESEHQMCDYAPTEINAAQVEHALGVAESADPHTTA